MIKTKKLNVSIGNTDILKDIDIEIPDGEIQRFHTRYCR